jgi:hypothetical protein
MRHADSNVVDANGDRYGTDTWAVDATYYARSIEESTGPYALASFLNPTTHVSAAASQADEEFGGTDPTGYTLSGAYVLPADKWYVGADYSKSKMDDTPFALFSDVKGYGVMAGRYLGANTTLELGLGRSEEGASYACRSPSSCIGTWNNIGRTTDSVDLEVFHVRRFRSLTYSLQGSVSELDTDWMNSWSPAPTGASTFVSSSSTRVYSVATELFPTQRFGVRVGYSRSDTDFGLSVEAYENAYDVAATWFFKPRVAVQFALSRTTYEIAPSSENVGVRLIGRL